jgi:hypothetical protein
MNIEQAKGLFVEALRDLLTFEQQGEYIIIKPRQYLGSENYGEVLRIVQANKGGYVSAGKESHFRIPAPTQEKATAQLPEQKPPLSLHFKVAKLTVTLGTTIQQNEKEWIKQSYGLEVEVNSDDIDIVERAKAEAEQLVQSWLAEPALPTAGIPQIDTAELNMLPWTNYKTKQPAEKGQAGWIFSNTKGAEELVKALNRSPDKKLVVGDCEYSFSGKGKFVSRKPIKAER